MPIPVLAAVQGAVGLGQMIGGALMKNKRPEYADDEALSRKEQIARNRMANPYAEKEKAIESGDLAMSTMLDNVRAGKTGGRVDESALFNAANANRLAISNQNDQLKRTAEATVMSIAGERQAYNTAKWDYEKNQPFQERAATKSALIGSGISNMFGGLQSGLDANMQKEYLAGLNGETTDKGLIKKVAAEQAASSGIKAMPKLKLDRIILK